jgi:hypothetical protein
MIYTCNIVAGLMDPADIRTGEEDEEQLLGNMRVKLFKLVSKAAADDAKEGTTAQPEYVEVGIGPIKVLRTASRKTDTAAAAAAESTTATPTSGKATIGKATSEKADSSSSSSTETAEAADTAATDTVADAVAAAPAVARIVIRRESHPGGLGTKVILNVALRGKVSMAKLADKALRLTAMTDKNVLSTYLLKTKTAEDADKLLNCVEKQLAATV